MCHWWSQLWKLKTIQSEVCEQVLTQVHNSGDDDSLDLLFVNTIQVNDIVLMDSIVVWETDQAIQANSVALSEASQNQWILTSNILDCFLEELFHVSY